MKLLCRFLLPIFLFSATWCLGCAQGVMPLNQTNLQQLAAIACRHLREIEEQADRSEPPSELQQEAVAKKSLVDPLADRGYDLDATLASYARRLNSGDLSGSEEWVVLLMLACAHASASDLVRWNFITPETGVLVNAAYTNYHQ